MNIENVQVGTTLIPRWETTPIEVRRGSGIVCIGVEEKGFRFRRLHTNYNGEEFTLNRHALETSQWDYDV